MYVFFPPPPLLKTLKNPPNPNPPYPTQQQKEKRREEKGRGEGGKGKERGRGGPPSPPPGKKKKEGRPGPPPKGGGPGLPFLTSIIKKFILFYLQRENRLIVKDKVLRVVPSLLLAPDWFRRPDREGWPVDRRRDDTRRGRPPETGAACHLPAVALGSSEPLRRAVVIIGRRSGATAGPRAAPHHKLDVVFVIVVDGVSLGGERLHRDVLGPTTSGGGAASTTPHVDCK